MKPFDDLARSVDREWRRAGRSPAAFPGIATRALETFSFGLPLDRLDAALARRLLSPPGLPEQVNLHNTFGQPPLTLFNDGRFVVDLYFWLTFDTSIHSHGFRGAFRVLHGRSLHEVFQVKTRQAVAPDVALVELGTPEAELLGVGDVRPIRPGRGLTHRVIHLENPTLTLCVKTINEPRLAQWKYFPGGVAIRMRRIDPALVKKLYYFQYLASRDAKAASAFLDRVLRGLDRSTCMNLYGALAGGAYDLTESAALHFAAQLRGLYGSTSWFRRYEEVDARRQDDLRFEACDVPLGRLVAHLVNEGRSPRDLRALIGPIPAAELEALVFSLLDVDNLFGVALPLEELARIRGLLANPGRSIPASLRPFGQIRKLRAFLKGS